MADAGNPGLPFRMLARFPKLCLALSLSPLLAFWVVTGIRFRTGCDIAPIQLDVLPTRMESSVSQQRASSFQTWKYDFSDNYINLVLNYKYPQESVDFYKVNLYYKVKGNILTMKHLLRIKKLEDEIAALTGYRWLFDAPFSLIPYLVVDDAQHDVKDRNKDITAAVAALLNRPSPEEKRLLEFALPSFKFKSKRKASPLTSHLLRSALLPGKASDKFGSFGRPDQHAFRDNVLRPFLTNQSRGPTASDDFEFRYWGQDLYWQDLRDQALHDTKYVIGSLIFIVVILFVHTQSFILTLTAIFGISSSVIVGNLVYRYIFDYRYLGYFHCVSLFIILGIGVDDVFVLFDVWRDSFDPSHPPPISLAHRLSEVYRKSALPMFTTSMTSALAFFVNILCEVPIIYTFGLFTGLAILCNYLMVITFLPCVLINQLSFYQWIKDAKWINNARLHVCIPRWAMLDAFSEDVVKKPAPRWMARIFGDYFFAVIQVKMVAASMMGIFLPFSVFFIWRATMVAPSETSVLQFFSPGTNWYQADVMDREMGGQEQIIQVEVMWGLKTEDRSRCHRHSFQCLGTSRYDDQLNLNLWEAQLALLDFCKRLDSEELVKRLHIKRASGKSLIECFLQDMHQDMLYQRQPSVYNCSDGKPLDLTIPIGQVKLARLVSCWPSIYGGQNFAKRMDLYQWYDRNIETAIYFWLRYSKIGKNVPAESRMRIYDRWHLALVPPRFPNESSRLSYLMRKRSFAGRILVMHIAVTLNTTSAEDYVAGLQMKTTWERFIQESNAKFPLGLRGALVCMSKAAPRSPLSTWTWYEVQEALWNNARMGISLGLFGVALPLLLLSTRNILLTLAGVTCLIFITASVMAMAQLMGWSLGISESVNFCVSTGLSVDYVIHFLEAYHSSSAVTRKEKVHDMLTRMGGAVTSGAVTTVGATSFLFASDLLFFEQFGAFMGTALGCSYLYALFLLTPFLLLFGPEGNDGSLDPFLSRMFLESKSRFWRQYHVDTASISYDSENDRQSRSLQ